MVSEVNYPASEEQDKFLKEASNSVKKNAYFMRKAMDEDNLREALRYSAAMLGELRTSYLSPQKYYELYMQVFDELANLEAFFSDERSKGRTFAELYELVQHAGNVLPRLYLMVAVGCLYIKSKEAPSKDILKDLVEMTKGVQHPTRGLFLRSYLCQRSKGLLPDSGSEYEGDGNGDIHDAVDFLLTNFIEMNKLWVRMQHQGSVRDRDKREQERQQLQDLVGRNLTYLCQLEGMDFTMYSGGVLPRVLEQIVSCKDDIAQQYLMQCVIQGFPDEFHLGTLDALLGALPELQSGVKLHAVMASLMDRLAKYAATEPSVVGRLLEGHAFEKFVESIAKVTELHVGILPGDVIEMYSALMRFTDNVHPEMLDNVNRVLGACTKALAGRGLGGDSKAERALVALLSQPLTQYNVVTVLSLDNYPALMALLQPRTHKDMAIKVVQTVLTQQTLISSEEQAHMLFRFIAPLVEAAPEGSSADDELDDEDMEEEQALVARLLHRLHSDDVDQHFTVLNAARERLQRGGPRRMRHTLPALAFCTLRCVREITSGRAKAAKVNAESLLQWLLGVSLQLADVPEPMMALRLLLCCAHVSSEEAGLEMLAYEFFEQAFTLYEESVAEARYKVTALQAIVGTLHRCFVFGTDNRDALSQSVTSYSAKLLKRADQCRAVCASSHVAWQDDPPAAQPSEAATAPAKPAAGDDVADQADGAEPATGANTDTAAAAASSTAATPAPAPNRQPPVRDAQKVMAALKRALKIVSMAKQQRAATGVAGWGLGRGDGHSHLALYLDILNQYLYYFDRGVETMSAGVVQQLLELVSSEFGSVEGSKVDGDTKRFWAATRSHIEWQKSGKAGDESRRRYAALSVPAAAAT